MKVRQVNRTATMAWSPGQHTPLIALGTASGALDPSFSTKSELEIFDLNLDKGRTPDVEMKRLGIANTNSRFNRLAWGSIGDHSKPFGILASGMENGDLEFWNPKGIMDNDKNALLMRHSMHSGPVRGLDFNPFQGNLLASGSTDAELFIWDLNNPTKPYSPGQKSQKLEDVTCVAWNRKFSYILASTSNNGNTVVWDLRNRKEIIMLQHPFGRRPITSVTWNPDESTQFIAASDDDSSPVIHLWDLRNARAPKLELQGHTKGVLSVSWCPKDSGLLLSAGKDNRTICWNPSSGEMLGEFERSENWTFDAQWNYRNPDFISVCSYDGNVKLFSLQSNSSEDLQASSTAPQQINNDPFNINNKTEVQTSFSLKQPPKWYKRPVGAVWTFGGKLVSFSEKATHSIQQPQQQQQQQGQAKNTNVSIKTIVTETDFVKNVDKLEEAEKDASFESYVKYCEEKINSLSQDPKAQSQEKTIWSFLKVMFDKSPREKMLEFLGFRRSKLSQDELVEMLKRLNIDVSLPPPEVSKPAEPNAVETPVMPTEPKPEIDTTVKPGIEDILSSGNEGAQQSPFFENMISLQQQQQPPQQFMENQKTTDTTAETMTTIQDSLKLFPKGNQGNLDPESSVDSMITRYLLIGDFDTAVQICFSTGRIADALIMAICGSPELLAKAREEFFKRKRNEKVYMAVLENIANGHVKEMISCIDLNGSTDNGSWKDIMALICTYAKMDEFAGLCGLLGQKLEQKVKLLEVENPSNIEETKLAAVLCYLAAGELDKVVDIWLSGDNSAMYQLKDLSKYSHYVEMIQKLVERVTILRKAISFIDTEFINNEPEKAGQFSLHKLYEKYAEYAEILVSQGKMDEAWSFLELIPESFEFWGSDLVKGLRDRIFRNGSYSVPDGRVPPKAPFDITDITYVAPPEPQYQQQSQQPMGMNTAGGVYGGGYNTTATTPGYANGSMSTSSALGYGAKPTTSSTMAYGNQYMTPYTNQYSTGNSYYNSPAVSTMMPNSTYSTSSYNQPPPPPMASNSSSTLTPHIPPPPSSNSTSGNAGYYNTNSYGNYQTSSSSSNLVPSPMPSVPLYGGSTTGASSLYSNKPSIPPPSVAQQSIANSLASPVQPPSSLNKQSSSTGFNDPPKVDYKHSPYSSYQNNLTPLPPSNQPTYGSTYSQGMNNTAGVPSTPTQAYSGSTNHVSEFNPPPMPNPYGLSSANGYSNMPTISNSLYGNNDLNGSNNMYGSVKSPAVLSQSKIMEKEPEPPAKPRYPDGDRSHIPEEYKCIEGSLTKILEYSVQVGGDKRILDDARKKFNTFYDQLNNDDINDQAALNRLVDLCKALDMNDLATAQSINMELMTSKFDVIGFVLQGIKRLLDILIRAYMNPTGY